MDIGSIYGNTLPSTAGGAAAARSPQSSHSFSKDVTDLLTNRTNACINSICPKLTGDEIRELDRKYDFRNMTQETYDAFLNEMVDKGVLTRAEAESFGYGDTDGKTSIIDQIRNPDSDFYRDMYNRMRVQLEESEEEKRKQAIIDALDEILQSLSAKKDDWKKKPDSVSSMAELSRTIDSLDKDDPRKEKLNLLRERLQNLGIYMDLDVGVKDKNKNTWGTTLTQDLIREEAKNAEPSLFDLI